MSKENVSPKDFLRHRRPERFSDSDYRESTQLDRSLLEYHLDSITSRSQEEAFERFARRLAEYEICPNLLPQTGPTGGGDSKVDSESYPVADDLTFAWFTGLGDVAAKERWAFAFSAKKDWAPKVKSDLAKIASTGRQYSRAFFITNQAVPDKRRAQVEDEQTKLLGLDVRILDRTWILDKVFGNRREHLAISELGVTGLSTRDLKKGPMDSVREEELEQLENRIEEMVRSGDKGPAFVEACCEAADLARQLERPRVEIEGRYARLDRAALEFGTQRQQVESAYQWAWTLYWWLEDFQEFESQYVVVEDRAASSQNVYDFERLFALWINLSTLSKRGELQPDLAGHTGLLRAKLSDLAKDDGRPSNSLQAETLLVETHLLERLLEGESVNDQLEALKSIIEKSRGLVGYPLEPLVDSLTEIGETLEGSEAYDELFDLIVSVTSEREGEVTAARLLVQRGEVLLRRRRPTDAVAILGRALGLLYKHESRFEIIRALYVCGVAYEQLGLRWAARGTIISAASIAGNEYWQYGTITPQLLACVSRIKWLELELGRVPHVLAWHEVSSAIRRSLAHAREDLKSESETGFDVLLARLMLRTSLEDLTELVGFPEVISRLGLSIASDSLLFALGYEEAFAEGATHAGLAPDELAMKIYTAESEQQLASEPTLGHSSRTRFESRILGCNVIVHADSTRPAIEVAESFLGALEGFAATTLRINAWATEPSISVEVSVQPELEQLLEYELKELAGRPHLEVRCKDIDPHDISMEEQHELENVLFQAVVEAFSSVSVFRNPEQDIEMLIREEDVFNRAISFTRSIGTIGNVLGREPKTRLSAWTEPDLEHYPLKRSVPWVTGHSERVESADNRGSGAQGQSNDTSPSQLDWADLRHDSIRVLSLIRQNYWDKAGWHGTYFATSPDDSFPPFLGLLFQDEVAGAAIFEAWRDELGRIDEHHKLSVSIIRRISRANPSYYRVVLGANPEAFDLDASYFSALFRMCTMSASSTDNLERFLQSYGAHGRYGLAPVFLESRGTEEAEPQLRPELGILMERLKVRDAWELGVNDIEAIGIREEDDPLVPEGVENPPVLKLLERRRGPKSVS